MSIYVEITGQLYLTEQHIYSSSKVGIRALRADMLTVSTPTHTGPKEIIRGERRYELTNHLGNVLVVCSDQLTATDGDSNNMIDFYAAEVMSYSDYYPFGAEMTDRSSIGDYRYGFNQQEIEHLLTEQSTHMTAEFWMMDSRIAKRWNLDPMFNPEESLYGVISNSPIRFLDTHGNYTGDYYNKEGEYLGSDSKTDDKVYLASSVSKNDKGVVTVAKDSKDLGITHSEFQNNSYLLKAEASQAGNAETALWMAHTVENARGEQTFNAKFKTRYSSLSDKSGTIKTGDASDHSNYARAAMIDVLLGGDDPTGGAEYWDGIDVFDHRSEGLNQRKFKDFQSLYINWGILKSATDFWDLQSNKDKVNPNSTMNCMYYDTTPKSGFEEVPNGKIGRTSNGMTIARTNAVAYSRLVATGFVSGTIFWKSVAPHTK